MFVITELTLTTLFSRVLAKRHRMSCCRFLCFCLLKNQRTPQQLCCSIPNTPLQYQSSSQNCNDSVTSVAGRLRFLQHVLKGYSASSQGGIVFVESTQIRWFSRHSGWGGWSGRAIAQRSPRILKLGLKGLSDYRSN
jgi:hypothetical protein